MYCTSNLCKCCEILSKLLIILSEESKDYTKQEENRKKREIFIRKLREENMKYLILNLKQSEDRVKYLRFSYVIIVIIVPQRRDMERFTICWEAH